MIYRGSLLILTVTREEGEHLVIEHGKLTLRLPRRIFRGGTAVYDEEQRGRYREVLSTRYPWLSRHALDVIFERAREEREGEILHLRGEVGRAKTLLNAGDLPMALEVLDRHLEKEPDDVDALYLRGEVLCRLGDNREGYRSIANARNRLSQEK